MRIRISGIVSLLMLWSAGALAHVTSTGVASLDVKGGQLAYRMVIVPSEVDELYVPFLKERAERVARDLRSYARFSIGGDACAPKHTEVKAVGADKVMLEMALACPKAVGLLSIRDDWPEVLGAHFQTVMTVNVAGSIAGQFAFLDERREASLQLNVPGGFGWLSFIRMGAEHIMSGPDHLMFLLALLALSRGLWPTVKIVTGFTVAHSITLSLAVLGWVDVPSRVVEPLIAVSIMWVAVENLVSPSGIGRRWQVAATFGLVHGLGFAGGLLELGLPREALARALVGFNVGVELGQIAFVAFVLPPLAWMSSPKRLHRLPQILSVAVAAMGAVWLVQRVFFSP